MRRSRFLGALAGAALYPIEAAVAAPSMISVPPSPLSGTVSVGVRATGGQLTRLLLRIDGALVASSSSSTLSYSWDTTSVADGSHVLRAEASYRNGRIRSETISVVVAQSVPPPLPPLYPSPTVYPSETDPR